MAPYSKRGARFFGVLNCSTVAYSRIPRAADFLDSWLVRSVGFSRSGDIWTFRGLRVFVHASWFFFWGPRCCGNCSFSSSVSNSLIVRFIYVIARPGGIAGTRLLRVGSIFARVCDIWIRRRFHDFGDAFMISVLNIWEHGFPGFAASLDSRDSGKVDSSILGLRQSPLRSLSCADSSRVFCIFGFLSIARL